MIIVSQDKTEIVNFDNITKIAQKDGKIGISSEAFDSNYEEIGKYKTEERAKEVLQEIIKTYETEKIYKCSDAETQEIMCNLCLENNQDIFKYEMPKE